MRYLERKIGIDESLRRVFCGNFLGLVFRFAYQDEMNVILRRNFEVAA